MIWGIVLIPIGLLMAIGIVIFLLSSSLLSASGSATNHATPNVVGRCPHAPNVAELAWAARNQHMGYGVLKAWPGRCPESPKLKTHGLRRDLSHPPEALCFAVLDQSCSLQTANCAGRAACHTPG